MWHKIAGNMNKWYMVKTPAATLKYYKNENGKEKFIFNCFYSWHGQTDHQI